MNEPGFDPVRFLAYVAIWVLVAPFAIILVLTFMWYLGSALSGLA